MQRKMVWHKLDNAAKMYSSILSKRITTLFRLSAELDRPVHAGLLQKSLDRIAPRFPYYQVHLRPGIFWYYFEENTSRLRVRPDTRYPCQNLPLKQSGTYPFHVKAYYKTVAVEFTHAITDGTAALIFLNTLLAEYLRLREGIVPVYGPRLFNPADRPDPRESEDSFKKNYRKEIPKPEPGKKAFHLPGKLIPRKRYYVTTGMIETTELKKLAVKKKASLSEYLMAVLLESLLLIVQDPLSGIPRRRWKAIRLQVPVNLRPLYDSITMRNFFLTVEPEVDPRLGSYTFDEILVRVRNYMQIQINEKYTNQQITRNVRGELHPLTRIFPLFLKNMVLGFVYSSRGEGVTTSGFSNVGRVEIPASMEAHIQRYDFIPPPSQKMKVKATVIGYKDKLHISFGRLIKETELERMFFTSLRKRGIAVKIETNQE